MFLAAMLRRNLALTLGILPALALSQLDSIPEGFDTARWAWYSNQDPLLAVIPGHFNRTVFEAPSAADVSDSELAAM